MEEQNCLGTLPLRQPDPTRPRHFDRDHAREPPVNCQSVRQAGNSLGPGLDLHGRCRQLFLGQREVAPSEVRRQERLGDSEEREVVLGPREAVTLVGEQGVRDRQAMLLHRLYDLFRLRLVDTGIDRALADQQRLLDRGRAGERGDLAMYTMVPMTPVEIPARDGLTLVSYVTRPKADKAGPMVLLVHGGPWGRDSWGYNPLAQLFANRGYATLQVNFRASTGFGKKFLNAGNLQWGKHMHDDLLDAVAWAKKQGIADKVCILGGSYGGYATLAALAFTPDAFDCGVDLVGPSNLITLLSTIPPYWAPLVSMFHQRMGDPATPEGKALLTEVSPLTRAAAIKKPLLIGQGANDPRVNQAESEQIVKAMQQHGLPVTYALFPDDGHGFARPENN